MVRGGGETFDLEISRFLEKKGCEVSFLTGLPLVGKAQAPMGRSRSYSVRTPYLGWLPWDRMRGGWRLRLADFWLFEKRAAAWAISHADDFDVIHVCELPTFIRTCKSKGLKTPIVMRVTAPDYYDEGGAIKKADAVIASGASIDVLRSDARPDCVDIPNGVDTDRFSPGSSSFREMHGFLDQDFVVLFVARFQNVKNHNMLMRAFAQLLGDVPDARLVLVGSGPLEERTKVLCGELNILDRVQFLGEVAFDQLPAVYAAADLKVISSEYESFCFAALEGMATGLPLVVTDTDWIPKLLGGDEGGIVVPKNNPGAFAEAMREMAEDPSRRISMGERNRRTALSDYRWERSAEKLEQLYRTLSHREP